ncbi:MAG: (d)CMP kinase [Melioribacteraceae bacterium]|nr:(d)CMP kinase [Melioribacteraceae bacterium]
MSKIIVAIDGPAASGKSTAAKELANRLGYVYMDTGAMYRAITYLAQKNGIADVTDKVIEMTRGLDIVLNFENGLTRVFVGNEEVTEFIRTPEVSAKVSEISRIPEVRTELVKTQRRMADRKSIVAEGRDITTVVFPNADVKIFMTADLDVRSDRRYKEFIEKGMNVTLPDVKENLSKRDEIDSHRQVSPLKKAEDAIELDTTDLTVEEELQKITALIKKVELNKSHHN